MVKPVFSSKLMNIWFSAVEAEAALRQKGDDLSGPILEVKFKSPSAASTARFELYKLRAKTQEQSRKGLQPSDPAYGTSPFDRMKLSVKPLETGDALLQVFAEDHSPFEFEILEILPPNTPKRNSRRKKPISDEPT